MYFSPWALNIGCHHGRQMYVFQFTLNIISVTLNLLPDSLSLCPIASPTIVICTPENPIKGRAADGTHFFSCHFAPFKKQCSAKFL